MNTNWFQLAGMEVLVIILLTMLLATIAFISAPFILWIRTNRYQDIYDIIKFHEENKKIFVLNDQSLKELKDMMINVVKKVEHMENNIKNNQDPARFYEMVNKIHDRLDTFKNDHKH